MLAGRALLSVGMVTLTVSPALSKNSKPPESINVQEDAIGAAPAQAPMKLNEAPPQEEPTPAAAEAPHPPSSKVGEVPKNYRVYIWQENGDTLWRIAQKVYGDKDKWPLIYQANKDVIKDPNKIYPKQVLKIPPIDWQP